MSLDNVAKVSVSRERKDGLDELTGTVIGARMQNLTIEENSGHENTGHENTGHENTGHENTGGVHGVCADLSKEDRSVDGLFEQMLVECQASSDGEDGTYGGGIDEEGRKKLEGEEESLFLSCLTG